MFLIYTAAMLICVFYAWVDAIIGITEGAVVMSGLACLFGVIARLSNPDAGPLVFNRWTVLVLFLAIGLSYLVAGVV